MVVKGNNDAHEFRAFQVERRMGQQMAVALRRIREKSGQVHDGRKGAFKNMVIVTTATQRNWQSFTPRLPNNSPRGSLGCIHFPNSSSQAGTQAIDASHVPDIIVLGTIDPGPSSAPLLLYPLMIRQLGHHVNFISPP
jgi:hypothetical protein